MIECKLAVASENIVRDVKTNLVSIFNIIEKITAHPFPFPIHKVACLFYLIRGKKDKQVINVVLQLSLNNEELSRHPFKADFQGKLANRVMIVVGGVVIPAPGTLRFALLIKGKEVGAWNVEVVQRPRPKIKTK